ncbi:hypothetical protein ACFLRF_03280 [Candidatus Altiarchaeota archaeon]
MLCLCGCISYDDYLAVVFDDEHEPDAIDDDDPSKDPLERERVAGMLQPIGKGVYTAGPTKAALGEEGVAMFSWTFTDEQGFHPSEEKILCVEPVELPRDFWPSYDIRKPLMHQDYIDKKANNLYIPFSYDGSATFNLDTSRIDGEYSFRVCGIFDEDYIDLQAYAGNGDKLTVEVRIPDPVVVESVEANCAPQGVPGKGFDTKCFVCSWDMVDDGEVPLLSLSPTRIESPEGKNHSGYFLLVEHFSMVNERPYLPYQHKDYDVYRWAGKLSHCGQFGFSGKCGVDDEGVLHYTVCLKPYEIKKIYILEADEETFSYKGDGDGFTLTYPDDKSDVVIERM